MKRVYLAGVALACGMASPARAGLIVGFEFAGGATTQVVPAAGGSYVVNITAGTDNGATTNLGLVAGYIGALSSVLNGSSIDGDVTASSIVAGLSMTGSFNGLLLDRNADGRNDLGNVDGTAKDNSNWMRPTTGSTAPYLFGAAKGVIGTFTVTIPANASTGLNFLSFLPQLNPAGVGNDWTWQEVSTSQGGGVGTVGANSVTAGTSVTFQSAATSGGSPTIASSGGPLTFNLLQGASVAGVTQAITLTNSSTTTAATGVTPTITGTGAANFNATTTGTVAANNGTAISTVGLAAGATSTSGTSTASIAYASNPASSTAIAPVGVTLNVGNAPAVRSGATSNGFGTALTAALSVGSVSGLTSQATTLTGTGNDTAFAGTGQFSTASIRLANVTSATNVGMAWRTRTNLEVTGDGVNKAPLIGDVVSVTGLDNQVFVLQLNYNQLLLGGNEQSAIESGSLQLSWFDTNTSTWRNAIAGNHGAAGVNAATQQPLSWNAFVTAHPTLNAGNLSTYLGSWGFDATGDTVWAVLDHNSQFAAIPEPNTLVLGGLALLGFAAHGLRKRRIANVA